MAQAVYQCYAFPATAMLAMLLSTHNRKYLQLTKQNLFYMTFGCSLKIRQALDKDVQVFP